MYMYIYYRAFTKCTNCIFLQNGGATCYMNSVLQHILTQPEIVDYLLSLPVDSADQEGYAVSFHSLQFLLIKFFLHH